MEFLGIGGWELATVLIIALVIAGPKRMIQWAYYLGQYVNKFRNMWRETSKVIEKELGQSGLDMTTLKTLQKPMSSNQLLNQFTKPVRDAMNEASVIEKKTIVMPKPAPVPSKPAQEPPQNEFGAWSNAGEG